MSKREYIEELANSNDIPAILLTEEFDSAIVGIQHKADYIAVVYSEEEVLGILMETLETDRDGALDYYGFNIEGSYVGEGSPIFIDNTFMEF